MKDFVLRFSSLLAFDLTRPAFTPGYCCAQAAAIFVNRCSQTLSCSVEAAGAGVAASWGL